MTMHRTAYLEHYANQYAANMLYRHGVSLDQYLADPDRYEHLLHAPFPLLPKQRLAQAQVFLDEVAAEMERDLSHCCCRNGALVEPLHHHRLPRQRHGAAHFRRRGQS